jgi:hypothetical protein
MQGGWFRKPFPGARCHRSIGIIGLARKRGVVVVSENERRSHRGMESLMRCRAYRVIAPTITVEIIALYRYRVCVRVTSNVGI